MAARINQVFIAIVIVAAITEGRTFSTKEGHNTTVSEAGDSHLHKAEKGVTAKEAKDGDNSTVKIENNSTVKDGGKEGINSSLKAGDNATLDVTFRKEHKHNPASNTSKTSYNAYDRIESESLANHKSEGLSMGTAEGVTFVKGFKAGSWLFYERVDFKHGPTSVRFCLSTSLQAGTAVQLNLRLGSVNGPVFHTLNIGSTRGKDNWFNVTEFITRRIPQDIWDVFLTFSDEYKREDRLHIDWFQFF